MRGQGRVVAVKERRGVAGLLARARSRRGSAGVLAVVLAVPWVPARVRADETRPHGPSVQVREITFIHFADTHGKLAAHWERFSDGCWHPASGCFAKLYTKMQEIRRRAPVRNMLLVNGDNFHGGAEAFFTRGWAVVPILNAFGIDAYTPGNWDFADGPQEFRARFTGLPG